jgi:ribosomal protein S18 acetylase RimI-like enzyme
LFLAVGCLTFTVGTKYSNFGLGKYLIQKIIDESLAAGARSLRLMQVNAGNIKAFGLYLKLGFQMKDMVSQFEGKNKIK